ncbi:MAG: GntR family transcriptional regulator [Reichenbachiella sp.]
MMIDIGSYNKLTINRFTDNGAYLIDDEGLEVLLPKKYLIEDHLKGKEIKVFVYTDSEDRPVATTETPLSLKNQFACLRVKDVNNIGAFLDWGLEKDLFVPFSQQDKNMRPAQWHLVYVYQDPSTDRLLASSKIHYYLSKDEIDLVEGQEVEVLIGNTNENGIQCIVNDSFQGLIYENEIFEDLLKGTIRTAFVKKVREDRKIDIYLRKTGLENLEEGSKKIMEALDRNNGSLPLHDKSDPDEIQMMLQMSKKNFKRSLGILYKKKLVHLKDNSISKI